MSERSDSSQWPKWLMLLLIVVGVAAFIVVKPPKGLRDAVPALSKEEALLISTGTIGNGGSLSQSLARSGVIPIESSQVERALKPLFNPRYSRVADRYEVARSTSGHFRRLAYWPSSFEYFVVERSSVGAYSTQHVKVPLKETVVGVSGTIQSSLYEAMENQNVPPEMIYRFAEMFGWRIDFLTEPRKGDTYKMAWKRFTGENAVKDGDIVCALYDSKEKGSLYAFRLAGDYFDMDGNSLRGEFLRAPLQYRRISSRFTNARYHPILRYYRPHHGIDYSAPSGTPVVSIGDGIVIAKGYNGGIGNEIRIRHAGSYVSIYGHLRAYARGVRVGSSIKQGQLIAYVGSTGLSTGPHLHFGMERGGQLINFLTMKSTLKQQKVPGPERAHFKVIQADSQVLFSQLQPGVEKLQSLTARAADVQKQ